jgi:hypothetical protein
LRFEDFGADFVDEVEGFAEDFVEEEAFVEGFAAAEAFGILGAEVEPSRSPDALTRGMGRCCFVGAG